MTYTKPTDPILVVEGGPIYNLQANGTIYAGQALTAYGTMECDQAANADDAFIGVAGYDSSDNEYVQVIGPGNVVRVIGISGACSAGDDLMVSGSEGKFGNTGLAAGTKVAVALESVTDNTEGQVRVLLI